MPSDEHLEALKKKLYERGPRRSFSLRRSKLTNPYTGERRSWKPPLPLSPHRSLVGVGLTLSLLFFLAALGYAGYALLYAPQYVSTSDVMLSIDGPAEISGGDVATFNIAIANNNAVPLGSATLIVEYPAGTKDATSGTQELLRERIPLDTINAGEALNKTVRALVFGSLLASSSVSASLEYRLPNSSALYVKEERFPLVFAAPPVDIVFKLPTEITSNQDMSFSVHIISRAQKELHNVGLSLQYPPGFQYLGAEPVPSSDNSFWRIGSLSAGDERVITISGVLEGQHEDVKGFHVTVGEIDPRSTSRIATVYHALFEKVPIARPALALGAAIAGEPTETVTVSPLKDIATVISWENTLAVPITNARIVVTFSGATIDPASVRATNGYYNSRDNMITWDASQEKSLASIGPGGRGTVRFSFKLKQTNEENPTVTLKAVASGTRVSEGFANEPVYSDIARIVRFVTMVGLSADAYYSVGPINNEGPLPPLVDQKTSYTITWALSNSLNQITDAVVQATLPIYVSWEDVTSPDTETVRYNPTTRTVLWSVGTLNSGVGVAPDGVPRAASFKVSVTPSISQIGQALPLSSTVSFSGIDSFTKQTLSVTRPAVSTKIAKDPQYRTGLESVRSGPPTP